MKMEAKVILTSPLELKAIVADAVAAALEYQQPRPTTAQTDNEEVPLNVEGAAEFLGITKQTVYQNIDKIPHRKRFGRLYFFRAELLAYLNAGEGVIQ